MANCVICNAEFNPSWGGSKKLCPKHCAPATSKPNAIALLAVTGLIVFGLYTCTRSADNTIVDRRISQANGSNELQITIKLGTWGAESVRQSADQMADIAKRELSSGTQVEGILFRVVGEVQQGGDLDAYGNPTPKTTTTFNAFDVRYSMDDLKKVNWDNMSGTRLLNLGKVQRYGSWGDSAARSFCANAGGQIDSANFCSNFLPND